jgi:hypothetical protein
LLLVPAHVDLFAAMTVMIGLEFWLRLLRNLHSLRLSSFEVAKGGRSSVMRGGKQLMMHVGVKLADSGHICMGPEILFRAYRERRQRW